jgi:transposase
MSLRAQPTPAVPDHTAEVARAAFPKGHPYLSLRDELGPVYADADFAALFAHTGRPAEAPACLALVTVLQTVEGLGDRAAAEAVRGRLDWKYLLGLELTDPGFHFSRLGEFRKRLLGADALSLLLDRLLAMVSARGLLAAGGTQRTDSTHVLAAIRVLNRHELVGETLRVALDRLAVVAGEWLSGWVPLDWFTRYGRRIEANRLPEDDEASLAWVLQVGQDGVQLLQAAYAPSAPPAVRAHPAVERLRRVWVQQYVWQDQALTWRGPDDLPPAALAIETPHDDEARYSYKRDTTWRGYKVHLTETCDLERPHLITHVLTTPATTQDCVQLDDLHAALAAKGLLPAEHLVDAGYPSASNLVTSQRDYGVDVIAPVRADTSWQARAGQGYAVASFQVDWAAQVVTCPRGHTSRGWSAHHNRQGAPDILVKFAAADCTACPVRAQCTRAVSGPRTLTLYPREQHQALTAARQRQTTLAFRQAYRRRAGVESTLSQGVRVCDLRRSRYRGLAKTHLQHVLTAVGLNLRRLANWFADQLPSAYRSPFAQLAPAAPLAPSA